MEHPRSSLRLLTLNVAHGARSPIPAILRGRRAIEKNLDAIAQAIVESRADVVGLQEIDRPSFWSFGIDHFAKVARDSGAPFAAHGLHRDVRWMRMHHGTALLSFAELSAAESVAFRTSWLDDKGYVVATVRPAALGGRAIDVVSLHLDPFSSAVRKRQIDAMSRALAARGRPLVVMGDMNASRRRGARSDVALLEERLGLHAYEPAGALPTYPAWRPRYRIDWILISAELAFAAYTTLPAVVSDHAGVLADVVLAKEGWS
jgi:endonuclease/exonuclease/phosphatase family metal-dependent hydrolase